jgi:SNF2 family DNA or RNA helicase
MIVRKNNNVVEISFSYRPELVSFIKTLEGRKYNPATKHWYIPLAGSHESIERLAKKGFTIELELWDEVKRDRKQAREAEALAVMPDTEFDTPLPLFPYQKVGAAFLYKIGSGLIGDEMGLGKTVQSLAVCEKAKAEKVLIFAPVAVKWQWAQEIEKFIPDASVVVIEGTKVERRKLWKSEARFYVVNYELLLRDFEEMNYCEWDIIIADEATKISNPQAKQAKAIKKLRARRRIAMTGTPISNRANEIWNIIDFCQPGILGNYWTFLQRYCLKNQWGGIFGYQNMDELREKLKRYMIRRLKYEVLPELPAKIITDIPLELSEEEKTLYKKLKKEILFEIEKNDIAKLETPMTIQYTLVKMLRLRQLADSTELLGHNTRSSKLDTLKELLVEALDDNKKAIVFTQFAEMADILERELSGYKPLKISGKIKEKYSDIVARFNNNDEHRVLIMTSAGQFGLNIQRASVIFHYDQEWSLAKMQQREGRSHRIGQERSVQIINLLARGTVDYYVKKVLHAKMDLSNQMLGDTPIGMDQIQEMLKYGG